MNLYLILFGLIALAVFIVGIATIYRMGMTFGAVLYAVGAGAVIAMYGLRWFGGDKSMLSNATRPWPPVMNTCPDFLTYYKRKKADGSSEDVCIDTMGVSKNATMLQPFPSSGPAPNDDDKYFFSLKTNASDQVGKIKELCQRAMLYGLTWEGITNGESCILPDGTKASPPSGSSDSGCPA